MCIFDRVPMLQAVTDGVDESAATLVGTSGYMAPEQVRGQAQPASDLYGLAALAIPALRSAQCCVLVMRPEAKRNPHVLQCMLPVMQTLLHLNMTHLTQAYIPSVTRGQPLAVPEEFIR